MRNIAAGNLADLESIETREWLDSLDYVLQSNGPARAGQLLLQLSDHARRRGIRLPFTANTPYINTLTTEQEVPFPGSQEIERRIKSLDSLERDRHGAAREQARARHRRTHFDVRVGGHVLRSRLQSFLQVAATPAIATSCITRGMPLPVSTRARSSKGGSPKSTSTTSAASWRRAAACRRIRIRG